MPLLSVNLKVSVNDLKEIGEHGMYINPKKEIHSFVHQHTSTYIHSSMHSASIYEALNNHKDLGLWGQDEGKNGKEGRKLGRKEGREGGREGRRKDD